MSYCQFENTYEALVEVNKILSEKEVSELSESERKYAKFLFQLCYEIGHDYS